MIVFTQSTSKASQDHVVQDTTEYAESMDKSGFVDISEFVPSATLDLRYFGDHNFIGLRINGYHSERTYLTHEAAVALKKVQDELLSMSLSIKIYDAYRPQRAVDHFVEWAENLDDVLMKGEFYPEVKKTYLFRDGYIAARSGHSRGSTLDLTIVALPLENESRFSETELKDCRLPVPDRYGDNSLDMGTGYDCFDTLSWTDDERIGGQQRANRLLLKTLMAKHGFQNYPREWWHYSLVNEPYPKTYFDFPLE